jgi:phenylacetate-CoA ligase
MNIRKWLFFTQARIRGRKLGRYYEHYVREYHAGIPSDTTRKLLIQLLEHCQKSVPYYREIITWLGNSFYEDPEEYLKNFPILTKDIIRKNFNELKSVDLARRKWYFNSSGGSTGEPVRFIQDLEFNSRVRAVEYFFSRLAGREPGEPEVLLWGSPNDILQVQETWQSRWANKLTNTNFINTFRWTPEKMHEALTILNNKLPKLIVSYVEPIYELARLAERERLPVAPQRAIITSAGTLQPYMREKIEHTFQCKVYNRYGCREVGGIACERPGKNGLWVAPWSNFIEIVDDQKNRVQDGIEGEILVTSLTNYAMPFIRYRIEDCGTLLQVRNDSRRDFGQVLEAVTGRTNGIFRARNGTLVSPGYFTSMLCDREWIRKYQVIQKSFTHFVFRIAKSDSNYQRDELDEIIANTKLALGSDCEVDFEFVDEISTSGSGKFEYTICELKI